MFIYANEHLTVYMYRYTKLHLELEEKIKTLIAEHTSDFYRHVRYLFCKHVAN